MKTEKNKWFAHMEKAGFLVKAGDKLDIKGFAMLNNGARVFENIKTAYRQKIININPSAQLLQEVPYGNEALYRASGHMDNFHDPASKCQSCGKRSRVDSLVEKISGEVVRDISLLVGKIQELGLKCPECGGELSEPRQRSLMVKMECAGQDYFMPPETAQHIFLNFCRGFIQNRRKLPFSIHQISLAARAELAVNLSRRIMFTQAEEELFINPELDNTEEIFKGKLQQYSEFVHQLGIEKDFIRIRPHAKEELSHYSSATSDIEVKLFDEEWLEIIGIACRGDFDLLNMQKLGFAVEVLDPRNNRKIIPHVVEPSLGVDRLMLAVLTHAFHVEKVNNEERVVMKLKPHIAPYQLMVTALNPAESNQREMVENLYHRLSPHFALKYESTGSIGRRYRRADEIGIPFCLTVDYDSPNEQMVTIRERDTMQQERIPATEIANYLISAMYKLE